MNPLFTCDHLHEVGRGTDLGKEWNYAYGSVKTEQDVKLKLPCVYVLT